MNDTERLFDKARAAVSAGLIGSLFSASKSYWQNGELWTLNPTRHDTTIGSFSINGQGLWHDFSSGDSGDLIDLICARDGCTKKEAAETIIKASGGVVDTAPPMATKKRSKPAAVFPVPQEDLKKLNAVTRSAWTKEHVGQAVKDWTWHDKNGGVVFCTVRFQKSDGGKDIIPYYWTGEKWRQGQAMADNRPLYRLDKLIKSVGSKRILIVEGEKCADIDVSGYILTTWPGGGKAVKKADWRPLSEMAAGGAEVYIWPDNDDAGIKTAGDIKEFIPTAHILTIPEGKPKGWDIADAAEEGYLLPEYIEEHAPGSAEEEEPLAHPRPYRPLGSDGSAYYFLVSSDQSIFQIQKGQFTSSRVLELAPLSYWAQFQGFLSENQTAVRPVLVQDQLMRESYAAGAYDDRLIRCSGFWRDGNEIILNDGQGLVRQSTRERIKYQDYRSKYIYMRSNSTFAPMAGDTATAVEGADLLKLFKAQRL